MDTILRFRHSRWWRWRTRKEGLPYADAPLRELT